LTAAAPGPVEIVFAPHILSAIALIAFAVAIVAIVVAIPPDRKG
jgi:hypothetical protein